MKHIKIFESNNERLNLKLGDHVKFILNEKPEDYKDLSIYTIIEVDSRSSIWGYKYNISKNTSGTYKYMWAKRSDLLFIPEYEIDAIKYNI